MSNNKKLTGKKFMWNVLLFMAILLFAASLITGNIFWNMPAVALAFLVHRFGGPILFADYYKRKRESQERFEKYKQKKSEV